MPRLGVIFDMDGVLVDSYQAHFESWRRMAEEYGQQMTAEQFAAMFGRTTREIIAELWGDRIRPADIPRMDQRKEQIYRQILLEQFPQMDGAGELLESLHAAGFALAVGSSGPAENVQVLMRSLPQASLIGATVDASDVQRGKPDPQVFLLAAERLGVSSDRCAVVEDAPAGIEAARRAGMAAIALTGTASRQQLDQADLVVDRLGELTPQVIVELIERKRNGPGKAARTTLPA